MGSRSYFWLLLLVVVCPELAAAGCGDPPDPADNCVPVTDANCAGCSTDFVQVPDPRDCHSFYMCNADGKLASPDPFPCDPGQYFDGKKCDVEEPDSPCKPLCTEPAGGSCLYSCGADPTGNVELADPYDCSVHYQCTGDVQGIAQTCPPTRPFFDGSRCQDNATHCCTCRPYCYAPDVGFSVGDPKDCRDYHFCKEEGVPVYSNTCPKGKVFETHVRKCLPDMPCMTLCTNVPGPDGCIDPFTCVELGYFAKCTTTCVPEYFHCTHISDTYAVPSTCSPGYVFHPDNLSCVKEGTTCP